MQGRISPMPMERTPITRDLRQLIRFTRESPPKLTQKAAATLAGMSEVYWRQIEAGHAPYATADMLARMTYAIGVKPEQLHNIGQGHVADLVEDMGRLLVPAQATPEEDTDAYLRATPGLTDEQREALVVMARALRASM